MESPDHPPAGSRELLRGLCCCECGADSASTPGRWRGLRCDEPEYGESPKLAFYCPDCAEREFGPTG